MKTGQQQALKKLKKKIDVEYDSRTDITGHFESEYDQGFCDGADWFFKLAEKEIISPSLNENQQELLDDLKYVYSWQHSHAWDLFYYLVENDSEMFEEETLRNFQDMPEDDSLVVLEAFSRWVLERRKIGE